MRSLQQRLARGKNSTALHQPKGTSARWDNLTKHARYLSEWEDNLVIINIAHSKDTCVRPRSYDLGKICLPSPSADSVFNSAQVPLKRYPHLLNAIKTAINTTLLVRTEKIDDSVTNVINHAWRMYAWMMKRGIFRLSQMTRQDVDDLSLTWPNGGWWKLLGYDAALSEVLFYATNDTSIAEKLRGKSNVKRISINAKALTSLIGLPISANYVPGWFIAGLSEIWGKLDENTGRRPHTFESTLANFARCMVEMNRFSGLQNGFDNITFLPFPDPTKVATTRFPNSQGRTKNLALPDAIKILTEAMKWVYDYPPLILELGGISRSALETAIAKNLVATTKVRGAVSSTYKKLVEKYGVSLPGVKTCGVKELRTAISTLQVAAFCLIASNHGRRRNEIIGHGVPYGLYFGCVRPVSSRFSDTRIDVYIAKSVRNYVSFWCNEIVHDAVKILEEISQLLRPLGTPKKQYCAIQSENRYDKLFGSRPFTPKGFESHMEEFDFGRKSGHFFGLAQVSIDVVNERAHPFRRLFGLIYKYRYDVFALRPLTQHYRHKRSSVTEIYLTDAPGTHPSKGVEALYKAMEPEFKGFSNVMEEISSEYFLDLITRFLQGEQVGGFFARLMLKLLQRLSADVNFREAPLEEQGKKLRERLEQRGYTPEEKEHGVCLVGKASRTRARSNCYSDGDVHPEDATPSKCEGCIHLCTTPGYRYGLLQARDELRSETKNFALPAALRQRKGEEADFLEAFVEKDEQVALENQQALDTLVHRWDAVFIRKEESDE